MSKPKIGIVIGSTRAARFGDKPAEWIADIARARGDLDIEIVDLRDYPLPFFEEDRSPAWGSLHGRGGAGLAEEDRLARRLHLHRRRVQPRPDRRAEERARLRLAMNGSASQPRSSVMAASAARVPSSISG